MAADTAGHAADAGGDVEGGERICAKARDLPSLASAEGELRGTEATGCWPAVCLRLIAEEASALRPSSARISSS